jgi:phage N-6-adenine-methyltransferase
MTAYMPPSVTDDWATPNDLFAKLDERYGFTLDVAASATNAKCKNYFTQEQNGLEQEWTGVVWCNPPYGRGIRDWVRKAYESYYLNGATVVLLLPARTDTAWFHDYALKGKVEFLRGRLKFGNSKTAAPFPSILVRFE